MKGVPGAKWRPRENLHLTLRFFGELAEPVAEDLDAELEAATRGLRRRSNFSLKGAGSFGGADPHALWVGAAESEPLKQLGGGVREGGAAGEAEARAAQVHAACDDRVSAAARRSIACRRSSSGLGLFEAPPFHVESFGLYSSVTRKSAPSLYQARSGVSVAGLGAVALTKPARVAGFRAQAARCRAPSSPAAGSGPSRSSALALPALGCCSGTRCR